MSITNQLDFVEMADTRIVVIIFILENLEHRKLSQ